MERITTSRLASIRTRQERESCDQRRHGQLAAGVRGATGGVGEQLNSLLQDGVVGHELPLMPSLRRVSLWCWWPQALAPFARCVGASARGVGSRARHAIDRGPGPRSPPDRPMAVG